MTPQKIQPQANMLDYVDEEEEENDDICWKTSMSCKRKGGKGGERGEGGRG